MEVAGPRLHVSPVDGFPMLRLTEPVFHGVSRVVKNVIEGLPRPLILLVIAPVMVTAAVAVKVERRWQRRSFGRTRVGRHGRHFKMIKFRSMVVNAEALRAEPYSETTMAPARCSRCAMTRASPAVGAFLRRYSLDELPQLFNVLAGIDVARRPAATAAGRDRELRQVDAAASAWSNRVSPGCGKSAGAATCHGKSRSAWTCATWRTGPSRWTL